MTSIWELDDENWILKPQPNGVGIREAGGYLRSATLCCGLWRTPKWDWEQEKWTCFNCNRAIRYQPTVTCANYLPLADCPDLTKNIVEWTSTWLGIGSKDINVTVINFKD